MDEEKLLEVHLREHFKQNHRSLVDRHFPSWDAFCCALMENDPCVTRRELDFVEFHLRFEKSLTETARFDRVEVSSENDTDETRCYGRQMRIVKFEIACPGDWLNSGEHHKTTEFLDSLWNGGRILLTLGDPFVCHKHLPLLVLRNTRRARDSVSMRCNYVWCNKQIHTQQ